MAAPIQLINDPEGGEIGSSEYAVILSLPSHQVPLADSSSLFVNNTTLQLVSEKCCNPDKWQHSPVIAAATLSPEKVHGRRAGSYVELFRPWGVPETRYLRDQYKALGFTVNDLRFPGTILDTYLVTASHGLHKKVFDVANVDLVNGLLLGNPQTKTLTAAACSPQVSLEAIHQYASTLQPPRVGAINSICVGTIVNNDLSFFVNEDVLGPYYNLAKGEFAVGALYFMGEDCGFSFDEIERIGARIILQNQASREKKLLAQASINKKKKKKKPSEAEKQKKKAYQARRKAEKRALRLDSADISDANHDAQQETGENFDTDVETEPEDDVQENNGEDVDAAKPEYDVQENNGEYVDAAKPKNVQQQELVEAVDTTKPSDVQQEKNGEGVDAPKPKNDDQENEVKEVETAELGNDHQAKKDNELNTGSIAELENDASEKKNKEGDAGPEKENEAGDAGPEKENEAGDAGPEKKNEERDAGCEEKNEDGDAGGAPEPDNDTHGQPVNDTQEYVDLMDIFLLPNGKIVPTAQLRGLAWKYLTDNGEVGQKFGF